MTTVDQAIFDALSRRRNVVLSGVGTLEVKRRKAKKITETRILPPQNVVVFNPEEIAEGETVVYLLESRGLNAEEARNTYYFWLENARTPEGIDIQSVGVIKDGTFTAADPLHAALNPAAEEESVVVKKEGGGGPIWLWILLGILLAAIALVLFSYFGNGFLGIQKQPKVYESEYILPEVVAESEPQEVTPVPDETVSQVPLRGESRFHVIAGSFAVEKNADDYIAKLRKGFPELILEKLVNPRNGNWLVSIFSAPTERQAYNKLNMYWDIDLDIWVYEEK